MIFNFQIPYSTQSFYIINFHHYVLFFLILVIIIVTWKLVGLRQFVVREKHFSQLPNGGTAVSMYTYKDFPTVLSDFDPDCLEVDKRFSLSARHARRRQVRSVFYADFAPLNLVKWVFINLNSFIDGVLNTGYNFILSNFSYIVNGNGNINLVDTYTTLFENIFSLGNECPIELIRFYTDRKHRIKLCKQVGSSIDHVDLTVEPRHTIDLYLDAIKTGVYKLVFLKLPANGRYDDVLAVFSKLVLLKKISETRNITRRDVFNYAKYKRLAPSTWIGSEFTETYFISEDTEFVNVFSLLVSNQEDIFLRHSKYIDDSTNFVSSQDLKDLFAFLRLVCNINYFILYTYLTLKIIFETNSVLMTGNVSGEFVDDRFKSINLATALVKRGDTWSTSDEYLSSHYSYFYSKRSLLLWKHNRNVKLKFLLKSLNFFSTALYVGSSRYYFKKLMELEDETLFPEDVIKYKHPSELKASELRRRYFLRKSTDMRKKILVWGKISKFSKRTNNIDIVILLYFYSKLLLFRRNRRIFRRNGKKKTHVFDTPVYKRIPILKKLYLKKVGGMIKYVFRKAKYYLPHINRSSHWMPVFEPLSSYSDLNVFVSPVELDFFMSKHDDLLFDSYLFSRNVKDNHNLELIWAIIPSIILGLILIPSLITMLLIDKPHGSEKMYFSVKAIGHQWYWSYDVAAIIDGQRVFYDFDSYLVHEDDLQLPDINNTSARPVYRLLEVDGRLTIPSQVYVRVVVTSADVIHSWAVPSLGAKVDAVPGRANQLYIYAFSDGVFYGQCSELCGVNHGFMPIVVETRDLSYIRYDLMLKLKNS